MLFNSSVIIGLTLTSIPLHSPIFVNSPNLFPTSITFQRLNFKRFTFHALYFGSPIKNLTIHKSNFEFFLKRPITIQQDECTSFHNQIITNHNNAPCTTVTYCTFQRVFSDKIGGALCISYDAEATSLFDHCTFILCSSYTDGGALYFDIHGPSSNLLGEIIITSSRFDSCSIKNNNTNTGVNGGAIYCKARSLNLANNTFINSGINSSNGRCCGGAVYAHLSNADQTFFYDTFEGCYIKTTSESLGGAIYILLNNAQSNVHLFSCDFQKCTANNGSALYSGQEINLIINATKFLDIQANSVVYLSSQNNKQNGLFIETMGISDSKYTYFFYIEGSHEYMNKRDASGWLHLNTNNNIGVEYYTKNFSNIPYNFTFVNLAKYSEMPRFTYYVDPPTLTITIVETQTIQITQAQTSSNEQIPTSEPVIITPTINIVSSIPQIITETLSATESNNTVVDGIVGGAGKKGLSTVAIIFIVLACVIFVAGLIIAAILLFKSKDGCYRNRCTGSDTTFGKKTTYF